MQYNKKDLDNITGTLSKPSKMPGWSYGIPAKECKTGSKLAKIPGSVCYDCYALKGCYVFPNVQEAQYKRLKSINDSRWIEAMAEQILRRRSKWFRWHDSGDVQSLKHLQNIFAICKLTPDVKHWLPTREAGILSQVKQEDVPDNLIIRLSATKVDGKPSQTWPHTSTVVTEGKTCPAAEQDNKCLDCRACWNKSIPNIAYGKH
jgi:Gene product 88